MTKQEFREYMNYHQFNIPKEFEFLAEKYPKLEWFVAQKLYRNSVA